VTGRRAPQLNDVGAGIDDEGRLLVETGQGTVALDAGEVHLK
jgi:hypothetical protein